MLSKRVAVALALCLLSAAPCLAQQWAADMFEVRRHDFGTVARGAKAEFAFVFTNKYIEDVRVAGVRSSCGCTTPRVENELLKTYEQGAVIAKINSNAFLGNQGATVTVTFDKPFRAEVQLQVRVFVRSDLVFDPPSVVLGTVDQGAGRQCVARVTCHGRPNWRILDVRSNHPHLRAEPVEVARGGGRVAYELRVALDPAAPPGYVREHLILVTNDAGTAEVPLLVEGQVQSALTISPSTLFLGVVPTGGTVTRQLVVRAKTPFRITGVETDDDSFEVTLPADQQPKQIHLLPVHFSAPAQPGKMVRTIRIETDLNGASAEITAQAAVVE